MISFRYHLVTIVALFLALALGLLLGTTVINTGIIDDLNRRTDAAVTRVDELKGLVNDLQTQTRIWEAFGAAAQPLLVQDQLLDRRVVIVTLDGVDVNEVEGVRRSLEDAGATVEAILVARPKLALSREEDRRELAQVVGLADTATPEELVAEAGRQLGARLGQGPGLDGGDLLADLIDGGYVALRGGIGGTSEVGGPGRGVVLVSGSDSPPPVDPELFFLPVASSLVGLAQPVVAAETLETVYPFVSGVRGEDALNGNLATVDNADTMPGHVAVVLSLRDLFEAPGQGGNYGIEPGATSLFPTS